jgi:hypothetical protein
LGGPGVIDGIPGSLHSAAMPGAAVSDHSRALPPEPYFAVGFFVTVFFGFFLSFFLSLFPMINLLPA